VRRKEEDTAWIICGVLEKRKKDKEKRREKQDPNGRTEALDGPPKHTQGPRDLPVATP
jgi:hypothetical protein